MNDPDPAAEPMQEGRPRLVLACGSDDAYALHLGVMLYSVVANLRPHAHLDVYLIDGGIETGNQRRIERVVQARQDVQVRLNWLRPDDEVLQEFQVQGHLSRAAYLRLLLPTLLPGSIGRVIYLDSDLVVETDLRDLWEEPLEGCVVAAVRDYKIHHVSHRTGITKYAELGFSASDPYFNSGVLLIDLDGWRRARVAERAFDYFRAYGAYQHTHDQEGLNVVLGKAWKPLDPAWNRMSIFHSLDAWEPTDYTVALRQQREGLRRAPRIVHFAGRQKPWALGPRHPDFEPFARYFRQSEWFGPLRRRFWLVYERALRDEEAWFHRPFMLVRHGVLQTRVAQGAVRQWVKRQVQQSP